MQSFTLQRSPSSSAHTQGIKRRASVTRRSVTRPVPRPGVKTLGPSKAPAPTLLPPQPFDVDHLAHKLVEGFLPQPPKERIMSVANEALLLKVMASATVHAHELLMAQWTIKYLQDKGTSWGQPGWHTLYQQAGRVREHQFNLLKSELLAASILERPGDLHMASDAILEKKALDIISRHVATHGRGSFIIAHAPGMEAVGTLMPLEQARRLA